MVLKGIGLLAADTARTKAYLQAMVMENIKPETCIVYSDNLQVMEKEAKRYIPPTEKCRYFDINEPLIYTLENVGISYILVDNKDINSEKIKHAISDCKAQYLIYSGYGGYILKPELFQLGKKFIHVHAGILPQYRGSTTVYYSCLQEHKIGATAIFLNEKIDEGEIIVQDEFELPVEKVDMDYIYEPYIRSMVLLEALRIYSNNGILQGIKQEQDNAETYFIIHPLLKHIALLEIDNLQKAGIQ